MNKFLSVLITIICTLLFSSNLFAQSTYSKVYNLLQSKCVNCHQGGANAPMGLDFSGTSDQVYSALINKTPGTSQAATTGYKLVKPGNPYKSFLFKKVAHNIFPEDCTLGTNEGVAMPKNAESLDIREAELIRQWIFFGAPKTGTPVNQALIEDYYTNGGTPVVERPAPPPADKGFQLHFGPVFVASFDEKEYYLKFDPELTQNLEINRMDGYLHDQSHHFIMFKMNQNDASSLPDGLRLIDDVTDIFLNNETVAVWQDSDDFRLPTGTAYFWTPNTVLDLNLHQPNFSGLGVLPADVYINIYTQPSGTAQKEMISELLFYDQNGLPFFTLPNGESTLSHEIVMPQKTNFWQLSSHTHKLGTDYDIFKKNGDGTLGEQIYEGSPQGYYDWTHPYIDSKEPYLTINAGEKLQQIAKFNNNTGFPVSFGLTTDKEMMIAIVQYVEGNAPTFVSIKGLNKKYCLDNGVVNLSFLPDNTGVLAGNGTINNTFDPMVAGIGMHTITYTHSGLTYSFDVEVVETPAAPIINLDKSVLLSNSDAYEYYQWYKDNEPIAGANSPSYTPTQSGVYSLLTKVAGVSCQLVSNNVEVTIVSNSSIGDFIWNDANGNGIFDVGETGVAGVIVILSSDNGIVTTTTDQWGYYVFNNLPAGLYVVSIQLPNGFMPTTLTNYSVQLSEGQSLIGFDFGIMQSVGINPANNPFEVNIKNINNSLQVLYSLPAQQKVQIVIYTVDGKEVKTLMNDMQSEGNHNFNYLLNSSILNGAYIVKVSIGVKSYAQSIVVQQ